MIDNSVHNPKRLFRSEVSAKRGMHGPVVIINPVSLKILGYIVLIFVISLVTYICAGNYTDKKRVDGILQPIAGVKKIYGNRFGTLQQLYVKEGQIINVGDVLFSVKTNRESSAGNVEVQVLETIKQSIALIGEQKKHKDKLKQKDKIRLQNKLSDNIRSTQHVSEQIVNHTNYLELVKTEVNELKQLLNRGQISKMDYNKKYTEQLRLQLNLQEYQRDYDSLLFSNKEITQAIETSEIENDYAIADLQQAIIGLEKQKIEIESNQNYVVKAQARGKVATILAKQGYPVTPDKYIMSILPEEGFLQAELYVPSRSVGLTTLGQPVTLRYRAFPYQKFGIHYGVVEGITQSIIAPDDVPPPAVATEPVYRITVSLNQQYISAYGKKVALQSGLLLEADLIGETRKLYEWLLDPLYSMANTGIF